MERGVVVRNIIIIGNGPLGKNINIDLTKNKHNNILRQFSFKEDFPEFKKILQKIQVDEVYIAGNSLSDFKEMQETIDICEQFGVQFAIPIYQFKIFRAYHKSDKDGFLHFECVKPKYIQFTLKRLFDIVASLVALVLLFPLFLAVSILIKLSSKGPVFFKQKRVGQYGKIFEILKFRSMISNAEKLKNTLQNQNEQSGPVFKIGNDPRITKIGKFIRKYSIDELPQLINVLVGDMSIVGPRPALYEEVMKYEDWQRRRLSMKPGITCIWQVSGRNNISFEKWMYLDMQYIDHWNLWKDFNLILKTIPAVILGTGK